MVLLVTEVDEVDEIFDDDRPPIRARRRVTGGRSWPRRSILFVLIAGPIAHVSALVLTRAQREQCVQLVVLDAAERAARPGPIEQRDLELIGGERRAVGAEHLGAELERVAEAPCLSTYCSFERLGDLLGLAAEHRVALLVHHDAVVEEVVHLGVVVAGAADLGDEQLHLVRLHLVGEDLAERLRVRVGELLGARRPRASTSSPSGRRGGRPRPAASGTRCTCRPRRTRCGRRSR